jgi:hypothetical protein
VPSDQRRWFGWRTVVASAAALATVAALAAIALSPPVQSMTGGTGERRTTATTGAPVTPAPVVARNTDPPAPVTPRRTPVRVEVPSIGVASALDRLVREPSGVLQTPATPSRAGWFAGGAVPGEPGPAVIAGHVDSKTGPAVFFRLRLLRPGALVVVGLSGGGSVRFRVTAVRSYPKDRFPTTEVYGPTPAPELRLITCGGDYDRRAGSYLDNVVAFAVPA